MRPFAYISIAVALALMLFGCTHAEKSQFYILPDESWPYDMHLQFTPVDAEADSVAIASIAVALRHSNSYEYSNIYVELRYALPDTMMIDTVNIHLADAYGHWYGSGMGVGYQVVDTIVRDMPIVLSQPITLRHIMRADTLPGIQQAGIIIVPNK